jgi:hypothetical protein
MDSIFLVIDPGRDQPLWSHSWLGSRRGHL